MQEILATQSQVYVRQKKEIAELFGFETRNRYEVLGARGEPIGYVAEQQKGFLGALLRQTLGHWRSFTLHFYDAQRRLRWTAEHPFRWFFQELQVLDASGHFIGSIRRRWSVFSKRFDVHDASGREVFSVSSPIWKMWTFPFLRGGSEAACIRKKWSGSLTEIFTDADNFQIDLGGTSPSERVLILSACVYVDLMYFENKSGGE